MYKQTHKKGWDCIRICREERERGKSQCNPTALHLRKVRQRHVRLSFLTWTPTAMSKQSQDMVHNLPSWFDYNLRSVSTFIHWRMLARFDCALQQWADLKWAASKGPSTIAHRRAVNLSLALNSIDPLQERDCRCIIMITDGRWLHQWPLKIINPSLIWSTHIHKMPRPFFSMPYPFRPRFTPRANPLPVQPQRKQMNCCCPIHYKDRQLLFLSSLVFFFFFVFLTKNNLERERQFKYQDNYHPSYRRRRHGTSCSFASKAKFKQPSLIY